MEEKTKQMKTLLSIVTILVIVALAVSLVDAYAIFGSKDSGSNTNDQINAPTLRSITPAMATIGALFTKQTIYTFPS